MDASVEFQGGWRLLRGCGLPGPLPSALAVVALHPRHGIALVDALPRLTPEAEQRLYLRLHQARFGAVYGQAWPPARHLALHAEEMARLPEVLAEAFHGQPAVEMPGGDAWLDTVTRALHPGLPLASAPSPSAGRMRQKAKPARRWPLGLPWRLGWRRGVPLGALLLAAGLGLGWALWPARPPAPRLAAPSAPLTRPVAGTPPQPAATAAAPAFRGATRPEAAPPSSPPAPAEPAADPAGSLALAEPLPAVPALRGAPPWEDPALPPPPGEPPPAPAFGEAAPTPAAAPPPPRPLAARANPRCQALVQRIQTGQEPSEDDLLRLHACRSGG